MRAAATSVRGPNLDRSDPAARRTARAAEVPSSPGADGLQEAPGPVSRRLGRLEVCKVRIEHEHEFDVPLEAAFAFITSPASWPAYWPGIRRVESGSRWQAPGDEARIVVRLLGRDVELRMTLKRFEPNRLVEYESTQDGLPDARHERRFEPTGRGFRYGLVVEYTPRAGARGLYDRLLVRRGIEQALRRTTGNLDAVLPRATRAMSPPEA